MKVKFTAFMADARNKLNGTVFSRNRGGAYARTKVSPSNPKTAAQSLARSRFGTYSSGWRALTAAQRTGWNDAVGNFPRTDQFGDTYLLSGQSLYVSLNGALAATGQTAITTAPVPGAVGAFATMVAAMAAGAATATLTFTATPVPAGYAVQIFATPGMSPGRNYAQGKFKQISTLAAAATSPANVATAYTTKYGAIPPAGQKVFFRAVFVNITTGQQGVPLEASCIVAA